MRPQELKLGSASAPVRRSTLGILLGVALLWRLLPLSGLWQHAGGAAAAAPSLYDSLPRLGEVFSSVQWPWVGSPLYPLLLGLDRSLGLGAFILFALQVVAGLITLAVLVRSGERWLDFSTGRLSPLLWAMGGLAVAGGLALAPSLLLAAMSLLYADRLLRFAEGRRLEGALRLGLWCGAISGLGGLGGLWLLGSLLWLPTTSHRFRGIAMLRLGGLLLAGWVAVLSPVLVRGLLVDHDLVLPFSGLSYDLYLGTQSRSLVQDPDDGFLLDPRLRWRAGEELLHERGIAVELGDWGRSATFTSLTLREFGRNPGRQLGRFLRRGFGFFAGQVDGPLLSPHGPDLSLPGLPTIPLGAFQVAAWLGLLALLPSWRHFAPLYLGILLPLLQASFLGLSAGGQLVALPFFCLFAAYGLARWWSARRWWPSWLIGSGVVAFGILIVEVFATGG